MGNNGRFVIIGILLLFWLFLAYRAFSRGDTTLAAVYALVGVGLSVWRFQSAK